MSKVLIGTVSALLLAVVSIPFIASLSPTSEPWESGELIRVDISDLEPGEHMIVAWKKRVPVYVVRRTKEMID